MTNIIDGLLNFSEVIRLNSKENINLENFLKSIIYKYNKESIEIENNLFNFTLNTDVELFERIVVNLIENALKHSSIKKVKIILKQDKLFFENDIFNDYSEKELEKIRKKFYSKSKNGTGIGLNLIEEICKILGYKLNIININKKFIVEIVY